jgi:hypothetical protein
MEVFATSFHTQFADLRGRGDAQKEEQALERSYKPKYNCTLALLERHDFMCEPHSRSLPLIHMRISKQKKYGRKIDWRWFQQLDISGFRQIVFYPYG